MLNFPGKKKGKRKEKQEEGGKNGKKGRGKRRRERERDRNKVMYWGRRRKCGERAEGAWLATRNKNILLSSSLLENKTVRKDIYLLGTISEANPLNIDKKLGSYWGKMYVFIQVFAICGFEFLKQNAK